jgi:hypothetical protein
MVHIEVGTEAQEDADEAQARENIGDQQSVPEGDGEAMRTGESDGDVDKPEAKKSIKPPTQDEFLWVWKVCALSLGAYKFLLIMKSTSRSQNWRRLEGLSFCRNFGRDQIYVHVLHCKYDINAMCCNEI